MQQPILQQYFQPYTIWTVKLPHTIINILNTISFGKGKVGAKRMDRMMIKISQMIDRHRTYKANHGRWLKCIPIDQSKWTALAGSRAYYQEMEQIICDSGIIERVVDHFGVHTYKVGEYARGYCINRTLIDIDDYDSKTKEIKLKYPTEVFPEISEQQEWLIESYKYLSIPSLDEVIDRSQDIIGKVTKRGQTIIPHSIYVLLDTEESRLPYVDIEDHISLYVPILCDGFSEPRYIFNGRMVDSIAGLPSWIRDHMITIDGEKAALCDCKALHHNIWWNLIGKEMQRTDNRRKIFPDHELQWWIDNVNGDGHSKLARAILREEGIDNPTDVQLKAMRDDVKLETLSHYNTTKYGMMWKDPKLKIYNRMFKLFEKYAPTIYWFIQDTKNSPHGHCNTSILMTRVESQLIQTCIKKLKEAKIHCMYVHDCLMVSESNKDKCREIMQSVADIMNIPTTIS